jgi:ABC-type multidrug transport system ATPase subunit
LIFDEPTTGLDPENRQDIWGFINALKEKGRTIMLTTHILEEADILSDRICIMNYGRVKITGTSSELKRKIGAGFKLNIILKDYNDEKVNQITEFVKSHAPSANLLDSSGGALLFVIPFTATEQITQLLKQYEVREDLGDLVDDLAVSNSTLEEVFIEVTKDDSDRVAVKDEDLE